MPVNGSSPLPCNGAAAGSQALNLLNSFEVMTLEASLSHWHVDILRTPQGAFTTPCNVYSSVL